MLSSKHNHTYTHTCTQSRIHTVHASSCSLLSRHTAGVRRSVIELAWVGAGGWSAVLRTDFLLFQMCVLFWNRFGKFNGIKPCTLASSTSLIYWVWFHYISPMSFLFQGQFFYVQHFLVFFDNSEQRHVSPHTWLNLSPNMVSKWLEYQSHWSAALTKQMMA